LVGHFLAAVGANAIAPRAGCKTTPLTTAAATLASTAAASSHTSPCSGSLASGSCSVSSRHDTPSLHSADVTEFSELFWVEILYSFNISGT